MKGFNKIILTLIFIILCTPVISFAEEKKFIDVPIDSWYYQDVMNAVEKGLINGKNISIYAPNDNLTYAEAVKLAACMHKLSIEGNAEFETGTPWYINYVEYAKSVGIISKEYNWGTQVTRAEFMNIFAKAVPKEKLEEINSVPDNSIPDVPMSHPQATEIYILYRAGVVQGSDSQYRCKPGANISRAEVAAILTRMIDNSARRNFSITIPEYRALYNTGYADYDEKIYEYYQAMNLSKDDFYKVYTDDSSINTLIVGYAHSYGNCSLAYSLYDIDKNGIPELIFSDMHSLIDIYALDNGRIEKLFENCYFGERSRLHILSDGTLLAEGSSGASEGSYEIYKFNVDGYSLNCQELYYFDESGIDVYMNEHGYEYLSLNEYSDRLNGYMEYSVFDSLKWNIFADTEVIKQKYIYNSGDLLLKAKDYLAAAEKFKNAGDYSDASTKILECYYLYGKEQMELNYVTEGLKYISMCSGYKDADDIRLSYYYEEATKAFDILINDFATKSYFNNYDIVREKLILCEGYKDSDKLLRVAEKLFSAWSEIPQISRFSVSLADMKVAINGNIITITKNRFFNGSGGELTLKFDVTDEGFNADICEIFAISMREYKGIDSIRALLMTFTDIKQLDDFEEKLKNENEWSSTDFGESFSMSYGGYKINIDVEDSDKYGYINCNISVSK